MGASGPVKPEDEAEAECAEEPGKPAGALPALLDDSSSSTDQNSNAGESNSDDTTTAPPSQKSGGGAGAGKIGKTSHSTRWAITKKAKLILEQIYQMERFPSSEMHRRLAEDFEVEPRQVQFWFQNRRQRDSRALKAAQLAPEDADDKQSGAGTTNAQAILDQLRMMNEARQSLGHASKPSGHMVTAQPYMPGQMLTPMFVPGQMLPGVVKVPHGQMYPGPPPGLPHLPHGMPIGMMPQLAPHQLQQLLSQAQQHGTAQHPVPTHLVQQHMAHVMHMHLPGQLSHLQAYMHHMGQQAQATPGMAHVLGVPSAPNGAYGSAPQADAHQSDPRAPASAFFLPSARGGLENNEDVAAATMMGLGLAQSHDCSAHEVADSARDD